MCVSRSCVYLFIAGIFDNSSLHLTRMTTIRVLCGSSSPSDSSVRSFVKNNLFTRLSLRTVRHVNNSFPICCHRSTHTWKTRCGHHPDDSKKERHFRCCQLVFLLLTKLKGSESQSHEQDRHQQRCEPIDGKANAWYSSVCRIEIFSKLTCRFVLINYGGNHCVTNIAHNSWRGKRGTEIKPQAQLRRSYWDRAWIWTSLIVGMQFIKWR
jgi:hypothetical protein